MIGRRGLFKKSTRYSLVGKETISEKYFLPTREDAVGRISHFLRYLKNYLSETQDHKTTFKGPYPISSEPKGEVTSFKIDRVAAI